MYLSAAAAACFHLLSHHHHHHRSADSNVITVITTTPPTIDRPERGERLRKRCTIPCTKGKKKNKKNDTRPHNTIHTYTICTKDTAAVRLCKPLLFLYQGEIVVTIIAPALLLVPSRFSHSPPAYHYALWPKQTQSRSAKPPLARGRRDQSRASTNWHPGRRQTTTYIAAEHSIEQQRQQAGTWPVRPPACRRVRVRQVVGLPLYKKKKMYVVYWRRQKLSGHYMYAHAFMYPPPSCTFMYHLRSTKIETMNIYVRRRARNARSRVRSCSHAAYAATAFSPYAST